MANVEWIKLNVRVFDNKKIKDIRRTYGKTGNDILLIWIMLLALAGQCNNDGIVTLSSTKNYNLKSLSDELQYREEDVQLALNVLEEYGMLTTDDDFVICINNWSKYQNLDGLERIREQGRVRQARHRERKKNADDTSRDTSRYITQENKKEDIDKEIEEEKELKHSVHCDSCSMREKCGKSVEDHFEMMWEQYTLKRGKGSVSKTQKNKLYKISLDEMIRAIERYKAEVDETRRTGWNLPYKQGSTFFNSGYLDYLDKEFEEKELSDEVYVDSLGRVHGKGRQ